MTSFALAVKTPQFVYSFDLMMSASEYDADTEAEDDEDESVS